MTLQQQAEEIIKELDLLALLNDYGEAHLVGNVALNTTVKPDIDVQIYAPVTTWQANAQKIIDRFAKLKITDYAQRFLTQSHKYLLSFSVNRFGKSWTIDITFVEKGNLPYLRDAYKFYLENKDRLTDESRALIREFKQAYLEENMLHNSVSYYIYQGVLEKGITNLADMRKYVDESKREIND